MEKHYQSKYGQRSWHNGTVNISNCLSVWKHISICGICLIGFWQLQREMEKYYSFGKTHNWDVYSTEIKASWSIQTNNYFFNEGRRCMELRFKKSIIWEVSRLALCFRNWPKPCWDRGSQLYQRIIIFTWNRKTLNSEHKHNDTKIQKRR